MTPHPASDCDDPQEPTCITIKHTIWLCAVLCALVLLALTPRLARAAQDAKSPELSATFEARLAHHQPYRPCAIPARSCHLNKAA